MFSYYNLLEEITAFNNFGCEVGNIGNSTLGERIPYIFVGNKNGKYLIVTACIHAREHATSLLAIAQAKHIFASKPPLLGGIYFIPMVNVDGVNLIDNGLDTINDPDIKNKLLQINNGDLDFTQWKANINGVDLNTNFDAKWGQGKQNVTIPSPSNFIGYQPCDQRETKNIVAFTHIIKPLATISYHSRGNIIFWRFNQDVDDLQRDGKIALALSKRSGYPLVDGAGSVGGYKDWCIDKLHIPAYTIEIGSDDGNPYAEFADIYDKNKDIPVRLLNSIVSGKYDKHPKR